MKTFSDLLIKVGACKGAKKWASGKNIESVISECHRGDWMLWLAKNVGVDKHKFTLAKALCAKTVLHLMKDERSKKAVEVAENYGNGLATDEELSAAAAAAAAYAAYADDDYAAYASDDDAYAADDAAYAAYAAAAADAAAAAYAADAYAYAASNAADAREKNRKQTADICREIIGQEIIQKVNEKINQL